MYNYSLHDRQRHKAEIDRDRLKFWLIISVAIAALLVVGIALHTLKKERRINMVFRLNTKRNYMDKVSTSVADTNGSVGSEEDYRKIQERILTDCMHGDAELSEMRERLRRSILNMSGDDDLVRTKMRKLHMSAAYQSFVSLINGDVKKDDAEEIWKELSRTVEDIFPGFINRLRILTDGTLNRMDERTALLVKCGFGVEEMGRAFGRSKSAIVSRRREIAKKIFGEKMGSKEIVQILKNL